MTPFLVRTRTNPTGRAERDMAIYIAIETEDDALKAVKSAIPSGWHVEDVIGQALPRLVERQRLAPGRAEQLA